MAREGGEGIAGPAVRGSAAGAARGDTAEDVGRVGAAPLAARGAHA
jgi:hypothetical protein